MIAIFFAKSGYVASVPLQDWKTVNAEWSITMRLPEVFEAWSAHRPNDGVRGLLLHHNNASTQTTAATLDYTEANGVQLVTQTPYSPDLVPCDFVPFPQVKQQLKGKQFQGVKEARVFFKGVISDMPQPP